MQIRFFPGVAVFEALEAAASRAGANSFNASASRKKRLFGFAAPKDREHEFGDEFVALSEFPDGHYRLYFQPYGAEGRKSKEIHDLYRAMSASLKKLSTFDADSRMWYSKQARNDFVAWRERMKADQDRAYNEGMETLRRWKREADK